MVLGDTPTASADSTYDEGAEDEEDDSMDSFASTLSALGTLVDPTQIHHVEIRKEYTVRRGPRCHTIGHAAARKSKERVPAGYYVARVSTEGRILGGVTGERLTTEEMMEHAHATR
eukprot:scaffold481_cov63-Attheya_sp.AAC.4